MRIKHSKYKNTGLIFELLVKQVTADTLADRDSPAIGIIKKYYTGKTPLAREYKLYEFVSKNTSKAQNKAETIVSTITEISRKLDQKTLKKVKYELVAEIKKHYDLDEFFAIQVENYKPLAALYCLLEAQNHSDVVNPEVFVENKTTLLEHLTSQPQNKDDVKESLIEEYSKYDRDLRLLTFKILLQKFNNKYKNLLPEQKNLLREFITSASSTTRLRNSVNEEVVKIKEELNKLTDKVSDEVTKIKLHETLKTIKPLTNKEKITDKHIIQLLQYYELVRELKNV